MTAQTCLPWCLPLLLAATAPAAAGPDAAIDRATATWTSPAAAPESRTIDLRQLPKAHVGFPAGRPRDAEPDQEEDLKRRSPAAWSAGALATSLAVPSPLGPPQGRVPAGDFGAPGINVAGIDYSNVVPADPTGDAGPNHYVQAVNGSSGSLMRVHDKATGQVVAGPINLSQLGSGDCAGTDSDPQVVFDGPANRWVLARLAAGKLCLLLSAGPDPVATTWTQYAFTLPFFPDYPKLAVWPSGYGVVTNNELLDAGVNGYRTRFTVLDRTAMLAGQPATAQVFTSARFANNARPFTPFTPIGLKGFNDPVPGAPLLFAVIVDDEFQFFGESASIDPFFDRLQLYSVVPDFANPANSTITGPVDVSIGDVQLAANRFPNQPGGVALPAFSGTLMHRSTYRNLGNRETIVLSTNAPSGPFTNYGDPQLGATFDVLWFELERVGGMAQNWTLRQQGRFAPGDGLSRFMSAINVDNAGNLALAYATLGEAENVFAGLRYTGRRRNDPLQEMTFAETTLAPGVAAQPFVGAAQRWGDYFDLSLDPDGCRFWFTGQYMDDATWGTRVASFRHDDCGAPEFRFTNAVATADACPAQAPVVLPARTLQLEARFGHWRDVDLSFEPLPAGISGTVTPNRVRPTADVQVGLTVAQGTPPGLLVPRLVATDGLATRTYDLPIDVDAPTPAITLASPPNGATQQPSILRLSWDPVDGADEYFVELDTDNTFAPPLTMTRTTTDTFVDTVLLSGNTTYFWRVRGRNACGNGAASAVRSFATVANFCRTVNVALPAGSVREDTITVPAAVAGVVQDLDIRFAQNNVPASGIRIDLTRVASNTTRRLLDTGCSASNSINTTFDDGAGAPACNGSTLPSRVLPAQALSAFDGLDLAGDWRLRVENTSASGGQFILWCLQPQSLVPIGLFGNGFE